MVVLITQPPVTLYIQYGVDSAPPLRLSIPEEARYPSEQLAKRKRKKMSSYDLLVRLWWGPLCDAALGPGCSRAAKPQNNFEAVHINLWYAQNSQQYRQTTKPNTGCLVMLRGRHLG